MSPIWIKAWLWPLDRADDRLDTGLQFLAIKGLGHVIIGAEAKAAQLAFSVVRSGQDQDRRIDARQPQVTQNLHPVHVGQIEIQQDQIVVIELGQVDPLLAHVRPKDVVAGGGQHQLNRARRAGIVLNQ